MGIEQDIKKLFSKVLDKYEGNKSAAAENLGVNNVTFWGWITGKRNLNSVLCKAIDNAGGILLIPGEKHEHIASDTDTLREKNIELTKRIEELEKEKAALIVFKIKWEGHIEELRAQSGANAHYAKEPIFIEGKTT